MEILDNMPHDRLYSDSYVNEGGDPDLFNHVSTISMKHHAKEEKLEELIVKLSDNPDPLISLYLRL